MCVCVHACVIVCVCVYVCSRKVHHPSSNSLCCFPEVHSPIAQMTAKSKQVFIQLLYGLLLQHVVHSPPFVHGPAQPVSLLHSGSAVCHGPRSRFKDSFIHLSINYKVGRRGTKLYNNYIYIFIYLFIYSTLDIFTIFRCT